MKIQFDGLEYDIEVHRKVFQERSSPRLVIVAFQPNKIASKVLQVCLETVNHFTPEPYELWVIDNNSPIKYAEWLSDWQNINIIFNRTEPLPLQGRGFSSILQQKLNSGSPQQRWGSYANAIGLEIALRFIDPISEYLMTLHMDTMPCQTGWLSFLMSKLKGKISAAGVRMDKVRTKEGVLHVLGNLINYQRFIELELDFFPQLPSYDVGDRVTIEFKQAGYDVYACRNTLWEPGLEEWISPKSPLRDFKVDRSFDDDQNVIFLHLGRGIKKSKQKNNGVVMPERWIQFAKEHLLK